MIDILILLGTVISYYLVSNNDRRGFFVGLCVQPFWIYEAGKLQAYGILAVSVFFLFCQIEGIIKTRKRLGILNNQKIVR